MRNKSVIVIGGSIAGLIAAKVLTDYFDEVTIIERDRLPSQPEFRPGVPQSPHPHMLLSKGREILEDLFPGLGEDISKKNGVQVNMTLDFPFLLSENNWTPRFSSEIRGIGCTRNLLELTIRDRINKLKRVKILECSLVTGLLANEDGSVVTGVEIKTKDNKISEIGADLIVDASGRNSQTPKWLENLGYQKPEEINVDCKIAYASRVYRRPAKLKEDWKGIFVRTEAPNRKRGGAIFPIENNCWIVVLCGRDGDFPSTKETEFLQFARSLPTPAIYNAIKEAEPLTDIFPYKGLKNSFKQYHLLEKFPENFVVLGDAVCTFNPVNGQGMTVAALEGLALASGLSQQKSNLAGFSCQFQKQLSSIVKTPWKMAIGQDLAWHTNNQINQVRKITGGYFSLLQRAACHDREVWYTFARVLNLTLPPTAFFSLKIVVKVLGQALRSSFSWRQKQHES